MALFLVPIVVEHDPVDRVVDSPPTTPLMHHVGRRGDAGRRRTLLVPTNVSRSRDDRARTCVVTIPHRSRVADLVVVIELGGHERQSRRGVRFAAGVMVRSQCEYQHGHDEGS